MGAARSRNRAPNAALLVRLHLAGMAGVAITGLFLAAVGNLTGALIEVLYLALLTPSVLWIHFRKRHIVPDVWANIVGVFLNGIAVTWVCDGVVGSGAFIGWSIICPMAAMVWVSLRASLLTSAVYVALLVGLVAFGQALPGGTPPPVQALPWTLAYNLFGGFSLVLLTLGWFIARLDDERRQNLAAQARLLEAQRFESLATLASGVAHDFNNAFMAISGELQLLLRELGPGHLALRRLTRIREVLERATRLSHQMLAYSCGGAPNKATAPLDDSIEQAASFVLSGSPVRLEFVREPPLCAVEADREQVARLVRQLVSNAAQAMPGGGVVTVTLSQRIRGRSEGSTVPAGRRCLVLEVRDRGHGIAPEHRSRLFDPFFTTREGHAGLGLTEVFTIVRDHGGAIEVESNPGGGSLFTVWLPACEGGEWAGTEVPAPPLSDAVPALVEGPATPATLLVMDDEAPVLEVIREMLELLGYRVLAAADGAAALEAWQRAVEACDPPRLAIFDLTVRGGMGGAEAASRLREHYPGALIVASSGYVSDRVLADCRLHHFDAVLRKPYRLEELRGTVEALLRRGSSAASA